MGSTPVSDSNFYYAMFVTTELEGKQLMSNEAKGTAQNRARCRVLAEDLCSTRDQEE